MLKHENFHKNFAKKLQANQAFDWKMYTDGTEERYLPWNSKDYAMSDGRKPFNLQSWHAKTTKTDESVIHSTCMMEDSNHVALQHMFDATKEQVADTASAHMTLNDLLSNVTQRESTPLNAKLGAVSKRFGALRLIQDNTTKELPQGTGLNALDGNGNEPISSHSSQKLHPELLYIAEWAGSLQENDKIN